MEGAAASPGSRPPPHEAGRSRPTAPHGGRGRAAVAARVLGAAVVVVLLTATAVRLSEASPVQDDNDDSDVERGAALFQYGCTRCHGTGGVGTDDGPSLIGVGAAAADFQLSTGRMPLSEPGARSVRKDPGYDRTDIDALVAYVASLGPGPAIPDVDLGSANLPAGGVAYRSNCAACHNAAGSGGALSYGQAAPSLFEATPAQVVEAMRTGPGQMPVFGRQEFDGATEDDIALYVTDTLQDPGNYGGLPLGSTGPVPEGLVAFAVGIVVVGAALRWTVRSRHG